MAIFNSYVTDYQRVTDIKPFFFKPCRGLTQRFGPQVVTLFLALLGVLSPVHRGVTRMIWALAKNRGHVLGGQSSNHLLQWAILDKEPEGNGPRLIG